MTREELTKMAMEDPRRFVDIVSQVVRSPQGLVESLTNYRFLEPLPRFQRSDEDPPRVIEETAEVIPIDEYLGLYEQKKKRITIFEKGIENASRLIGCRRDDLKFIVELHEYSHAIIHLGIPRDEFAALREPDSFKRYLSRVSRIYSSIDKKLHEHLAQLLAYHSLRFLVEQATYEEAKDAIERRIETFRLLNDRQPYDYRVQEYLEIGRDRVLKSVELLKRGWLSGNFDAWSTVVSW